MEPTQRPIQWVLGVKRPWRESDHSPPRSRMTELYLHSHIRVHGVVLDELKHRDNFTFFYHRTLLHSCYRKFCGFKVVSFFNHLGEYVIVNMSGGAFYY
jgi:hypothetical protein